MTAIRRSIPLLAVFLTALVIVQTTDLVACADETATAEHEGGTHDDAPLVQGGHPTPAPGDSHGDLDHEDSFADCLCHVVFTPVVAVPEMGERPASERARYARYAVTPPDVEPMGLDHVPLA